MFKVGDIVEYAGCIGTVTVANDGDWHPVQGKFPTIEGMRSKSFTKDGKDESWCAAPSLKFMARPKKKIQKVFYTGLYKNNSSPTGYSVDGLLIEDKDEADKKFANYLAVVEIVAEIEVD